MMEFLNWGIAHPVAFTALGLFAYFSLAEVCDALVKIFRGYPRGSSEIKVDLAPPRS